MQKKYGFKPLGAADGPVKTAIFCGNNMRLYDVKKRTDAQRRPLRAHEGGLSKERRRAQQPALRLRTQAGPRRLLNGRVCYSGRGRRLPPGQRSVCSHAGVRLGRAVAGRSDRGTGAVWCIGAATAQELRLLPDRPLTFADADGRVVRSTEFAGQWLLVYFGYTHCTDLCPTGLSVLANALDQIGQAADHVQPLFITVDPERDRGPFCAALRSRSTNV